MKASSSAVLLALVAGTQLSYHGVGQGYCGCDDFCNGRCYLAGPGKRENLTVYRVRDRPRARLSSANWYYCAAENFCLYQVTPYNVSGLLSKNTGDPSGDLFFRLGDELWLRSLCRHHPELHYDRCPGGNWGDAGLLKNDVYAQFTIETDGKYGPYAQCNPTHGSSRVFSCEPNFCNCPR